MLVRLRTTPTKLIPNVYVRWTPSEGIYGKKNTVLYIGLLALVPRPHGYCPQSRLGHDEDAQLRYNK